MLLAMLPNIISILRVVLTPLVIFLIMQHSVGAFWWALGLFTLAALTDFWDGSLARRLKASSALGAFIDPLADKIFVLGVLTAFTHENILSLGLLFIFVGRDLFLTVLRSVVASHGVIWKTSQLAKWKTFLQFIVLYGGFGVLACRIGIITVSVDVVQKIFLAVVWPIALLTLYSALDYLINYREQLESIITKALLPTWVDNVCLGCATLGYAWVRMPAPGTMASILTTLVAYGLGLRGVWAGLALGILLVAGWVCATRAASLLEQEDPGVIVVDEIVAMLLVCLCIQPAAWWVYLIALAVFRLLDICKPFPINVIERTVKGGLGIMADDLVAAILTVAFVRFIFVCL